LHIYGTGPDEGPIRDLIVARGLQTRVFCHGEYPGGKGYAALLCDFDMTLLPSIGAEGAPLVLLESISCGVPFVALDVGGIRDYENPNCEIVDINPSSKFFDAIGRLAMRLAEGQVAHTELQAFYVDNFSYNALKQRWLVALNQEARCERGA
jgi:glycosyltransferase involved in cell wall biosynthesis